MNPFQKSSRILSSSKDVAISLPILDCHVASAPRNDTRGFETSSLNNQRGVVHILAGVMGLVAVLFATLFFLNFSISKPPELDVNFADSDAGSLTAKLASLSMVGAQGVGTQEAPCYKVKPGCEFWAEREGGFPSDYEFSEQEEDCMFDWCESWQPVSVKLEATGEEVTAYLSKFSIHDSVPFKNPKLIFENGLIKASADVDDIISGHLYVEGSLSRKDETNIDFQIERIQINNLGLMGATKKLAETRINEFFNKQLSYLGGFRIDVLEVREDVLYFEGSPSLLSPGADDEYTIQADVVAF